MTVDLCSQDVSVVIQGAIFENGVNIAEQVVGSVRKWLPDAQIILCTHDDLPQLSFVDVTLVKAVPANSFVDINGNCNNVNKLIASMTSGLELATREYCIKLRTDHVLVDGSMLCCIAAMASNAEKAQLFHRKIGVSNLFLRNPLKMPYLFHLTDTLQYGRTEDLRKLWSIGQLPENFLYLQNGPRINPIGTFQGFTSFRLLPEQAIFLRFAQKNGLALDLEHISHTSFKLFNAWEELLLNNFEVHDWQSLGVVPPARFLSRPYASESVIAGFDVGKMRAHRLPRHRALRYARLLLNKYLLCWFNCRWLVSVASLLLFSFSPKIAIASRNRYRRFTGAGRT
ncbi:WavE lipopolysaccharide synthesis family protein [Pseudomonas umsongensis]